MTTDVNNFIMSKTSLSFFPQSSKILDNHQMQVSFQRPFKHDSSMLFFIRRKSSNVLLKKETDGNEKNCVPDTKERKLSSNRPFKLLSHQNVNRPRYSIHAVLLSPKHFKTMTSTIQNNQKKAEINNVMTEGNANNKPGVTRSAGFQTLSDEIHIKIKSPDASSRSLEHLKGILKTEPPPVGKVKAQLKGRNHPKCSIPLINTDSKITVTLSKRPSFSPEKTNELTSNMQKKTEKKDSLFLESFDFQTMESKPKLHSPAKTAMPTINYTTKKIQKKSSSKRIENNNLRSLLRKIYDVDPQITQKIKTAKKKKFLSLEEYQKNLLDSVTGSFSKESIAKLGKKFKDLRRSTSKQYDSTVKFFQENLESIFYKTMRKSRDKSLEENEVQHSKALSLLFAQLRSSRDNDPKKK